MPETAQGGGPATYIREYRVPKGEQGRSARGLRDVHGRALLGSRGYNGSNQGVNAVPAEYMQSRAVEHGTRAPGRPRLPTSTSDERRRQP